MDLVTLGKRRAHLLRFWKQLQDVLNNAPPDDPYRLQIEEILDIARRRMAGEVIPDTAGQRDTPQ